MSAIELINGQYPEELKITFPCSYCRKGKIYSIQEKIELECTACDGTGEVQEISE